MSVLSVTVYSESRAGPCKNRALNKYLFKEKLLNEKKLHISQDEKLHNH